MHYSRLRNRGTLEKIPRRVNTIDDLWGRIDKNGPNGCWVWTAALNAAGYGVVGMGGKVVRVHRVIYEHMRGAIDRKLVLDHLCRNEACCNPDHLDPVTDGENFRRGMHYAAISWRTGMCKRGLHQMSVHAHVRPNGSRYCKPCQVDNVQKRKANGVV